jgi:hypothetical protein
MLLNVSVHPCVRNRKRAKIRVVGQLREVANSHKNGILMVVNGD